MRMLKSIRNKAEGVLERVRPATATQVAALCYRERKGDLEFLLVTTLGKGEWILPKGWPLEGKSLAESAAIEAFQEAGVKGQISSEPVASYTYTKRRAGGEVLFCKALVFPIEILRFYDSFDEKNKRQRAWFSRHQAADAVSLPELRDLLLNFTR